MREQTYAEVELFSLSGSSRDIEGSLLSQVLIMAQVSGKIPKSDLSKND